MSAGHQPMLVKAQTPHVSGKPLDTMAHSGFSQSKRFQELPGPKDCLPKEEMKVGNGHSVALGDSESRGGKSGCRGLRPCQLPRSPAAPCCAQLGPHLTPTPSPEQVSSLLASLSGRLQAASLWPAGKWGGKPVPLPGADLFLRVPTIS